MTTELPADSRPLREILAAQFLGLARLPGLTAAIAKDSLHQYVTAAEDTIKQQAKMLRDDLDDLGQLARARHDIRHLQAQNASLRALVAEAIVAGATNDKEAIGIIYTALERSA